MLIPSSRHTKEDLRLWHEQSEADSVHAMDSGFLRRCQAIKEAIQQFHRRPKPYYVATSWGKDSVVLLHLFRALKYPCKVVHVRQLDNENPHDGDVRDEFLRRYDCDYEEVAYSYKDSDETWFRDGKPVRWYQVLRDLAKRYGTHVTGVRADESSTRLLRFKTYGLETRHSFAPLHRFSCEDVFAYLAMFDLPVHPNYAMQGGGRYERQWVRTSAIGNERGRGMSRGAWEQEYYGDVLARMQVRTA